MRTKFLTIFILLAGFTITLPSCLKDLDTEPFFGLNAEVVFSDPANYVNVLAKIYAGLATTGNQGPAGDADISGIDEGFSSYLRIWWKLQTVPTDEAVLGWLNDGGIPELNRVEITSLNPWVEGMYARIYFQLALCNEFVRQSENGALQDRDFSQADIDRITGYRNEVRFLRALSYYHAIDLFGNVPFITEDDAAGSDFPVQGSRSEVFDYVESELLAIESLLPEPGANEYGRADKAAIWSLLAKLYLNAETYVGRNAYTECVTYCNKIINAGYTLEPDYRHLFYADNHKSNEIIFPVTFDGVNTQTWGGTTFLVHAPVGGTMNPDDFGINGGWSGLRSTPELVDQFVDTLDGRYLFHSHEQQKEITDLGTFEHGYGVNKWKNIDQNGVAGSDQTGDHVDTDYPMFRLGDIYLMYAEAVLRGGGGGSQGQAVTYMNDLQERAFGNSSNNVTDITLDWILSERSRELYWEAGRRSDLIRFGRYTGGTYNWTFKGCNCPEGASIGSHLNLYPIPQSDIVANTNLVQNPGY